MHFLLGEILESVLWEGQCISPLAVVDISDPDSRHEDDSYKQWLIVSCTVTDWATAKTNLASASTSLLPGRLLCPGDRTTIMPKSCQSLQQWPATMSYMDWLHKNY